MSTAGEGSNGGASGGNGNGGSGNGAGAAAAEAARLAAERTRGAAAAAEAARLAASRDAAAVDALRTASQVQQQQQTGPSLSGTDLAARDTQQRLAGSGRTRVSSKRFTGYVKTKTTVPSLNFSFAAVNPEEAIDMLDDMVEAHGITAADPAKYTDMMDSIYSIFYENDASPEMNMAGEITGYGGVVVKMPIIREILSPKVGTNYRRWVRGCADFFWEMATTNTERFSEMFERRQKEWNLSTVSDAIGAMDGMDKCSRLSPDAVQRNVAARNLKLRTQGAPQSARVAGAAFGQRQVADSVDNSE